MFVSAENDVCNPSKFAEGFCAPQHELSEKESFCVESLHHFLEADVSGGKLSEETLSRLNLMESNTMDIGALAEKIRSKEEKDEDDRPIRQRSEKLTSIFANQSELDIYRFNTDQRLSVLSSNILLGIVRKVSLFSILYLYSIFPYKIVGICIVALICCRVVAAWVFWNKFQIHHYSSCPWGVNSGGGSWLRSSKNSFWR